MQRIEGGVAQAKGLVYKPNISAMVILDKISHSSDPDKRWQEASEAFKKIDDPRTGRGGDIY